MGLIKTLEISKNYRELPKCNQRATAQQRNISPGCLQNLLRDEAALKDKESIIV